MSKNFARTTVAVAPSPALSGTSLTVASGTGGRLFAGLAVLHPAGSDPTPLTAEVVTVTGVVGDVVSIARGVESSTPRVVAVGDVITQGITAGAWDALLADVAGKLSAAGTAVNSAAVGGVTVTGTPAAGQVLKATSPSAATWQADATVGGAAHALAERDALTGVVPPRLSPAPTIVGPAKGSGLTGTPTVSAGGVGYVVGDQITLAGGTSSVAAILQVATVSAGAVATVTIVRNGMYSATPSNAVAQASTTGSGTGATFAVSWSANGQSTSLTRQTVGPLDGRFRFTGNGPSNLSASGFYGNSVANSVHTSWEWSSNSQRVDIPMIGLNTQATLYVNGLQVASATLATDASGTQYLYALDFGSTGWRTFRLTGFNLAFGGVRIDGTATLAGPLTVRPLMWTIGDSYSLGVGAENPATTHIGVMADLLGVDVVPDGVGGSGWGTPAPNSPADRVAARLVPLTRNVEYVCYDLGFNDAGGNLATVAASFDAAHAAVKASGRVDAVTKYFCFGPATPVGRTANLDAIRDTLIARCAAAGDVEFIDVGDWVSVTNKTSYTGVDNVHASPVGHKFLGGRRALVVGPLL